MPSINDVADHILASCSNDLTNRELQKLLYLAQGFHLAQTGQELFREDFSAWKFGPVNPKIFHDYKSLGYLPIPRPSAEKLPQISPAVMAFISSFLITFGGIGQNRLIEFSHADMPWAASYIPDQNVKLEKSKLREYFQNFSSFDDYKEAAEAKFDFHRLIADRSQYLKKLPSIGGGWISGKAAPPSNDVVNMASKFLVGFERFLFSSAAKPIIPRIVMGPIPTGGVSIEFHGRSATYLNFYNNDLVEVECERNGEFSELDVPFDELDEDFNRLYEMVIT